MSDNTQTPNGPTEAPAPIVPDVETVASKLAPKALYLRLQDLQTIVVERFATMHEYIESVEAAAHERIEAAETKAKEMEAKVKELEGKLASALAATIKMS